MFTPIWSCVTVLSRSTAMPSAETSLWTGSSSVGPERVSVIYGSHRGSLVRIAAQIAGDIARPEQGPVAAVAVQENMGRDDVLCRSDSSRHRIKSIAPFCGVGSRVVTLPDRRLRNHREAESFAIVRDASRTYHVVADAGPARGIRERLPGQRVDGVRAASWKRSRKVARRGRASEGTLKRTPTASAR